MKDTMVVLREKLENVSDSYFEFVDGILFDCEHDKDKNPNIAQQLLEYMNCNPDLSSSDILDYEMTLIGMPYCDDDGVWRRWDKIITEEEAYRIAQTEYCDD